MIALNQILPKLQAQRNEMLAAIEDPAKSVELKRRWGLTVEQMTANLTAISKQIEEMNRINRARR